MEPMELTVYKVYKAPTGITFMNNTNTYTRLASSINVSPAPPFYSQSFAVCDTGDLAISGGFIGPPPGTLPANVYDAIPVEDMQILSGTWEVILKSLTNFREFNAKVLCFNNP
jgi:hypothetical protein